MKKNIHHIETHWKTYGKGPQTMIMLHGWGGSNASFETLAPALAQENNLTILVPSFPGHGQSAEPPKSGWHIADFSDWLETFIAENKIENPLFYGHSFGCRVIVKYLSTHPEHTAPVILTGAAGIKWPLGIRGVLKRLSRHCSFVKKILPEKIYKLVLRKVLRAHDWANVSDTMKKTYLFTIEEADIRPKLPHIKNKTLLLWGKKDTYTPIKSAHVYQDLLPNATIKIFKTGRHGIHYTHTKEIRKEIGSFLIKTSMNRE